MGWVAPPVYRFGGLHHNGAGDDYAELAPGNKAVLVTVDTGSLTLPASWRARYLSP